MLLFFFKALASGSLLALNPLKSFFLFKFKAASTLVLFALHALAMSSVLFFNSGTAGIIFSNALLSCLLFESQSLLPLILFFLETALAFKFFGFAPQALLLKLGSTFLISGLCGEGPPLSIFLLESESLSFLLLLPETIFSFKLLTAQPELLSVALSFKTFGLLKLALVQLGKLSLDFLLILFSLAL